jgi:hypothetical protein
MPVSLFPSEVLPWTLLGRSLYFSTPTSSTRISSHVSDKQMLTCFVVLITKSALFRQMAATVESFQLHLPCILRNELSCIGICSNRLMSLKQDLKWRMFSLPDQVSWQAMSLETVFPVFVVGASLCQWMSRLSLLWQTMWKKGRNIQAQSQYFVQ